MAPSVSEAKLGQVAEIGSDAEWESALADNDVVSFRLITSAHRPSYPRDIEALFLRGCLRQGRSCCARGRGPTSKRCAPPGCRKAHLLLASQLPNPKPQNRLCTSHHGGCDTIVGPLSHQALPWVSAGGAQQQCPEIVDHALQGGPHEARELGVQHVLTNYNGRTQAPALRA